MDPRTGEFHSLMGESEIETALREGNLVGPFERGDAVGMGNIVMTHQFGLTVRIAQVGAVVEHLGQRFRVMKLENGNAVLRSMVGAPGKTHDPAKVAAADDKLTKQVVEDGEEFCSEAELVEPPPEIERVYGGHGNEVIVEGGPVDDLRKKLEEVERLQDEAEQEPVKNLLEDAELTEHVPDALDKALTEDKALCDALCAIEEGLTDWEVQFIEDITRANEQGDRLTPAQVGKANEILTEKS